jgi:hypothetical protein
LFALLTACSTTPRTPVEPNDEFAYVWIATPRPGGETVRASHFQALVAIELAQRGYRQDSSGALAIAISFSGAGDPSLGPHQGGYAVFTPPTQCSAEPRQPGKPIAGCISIFDRASGRLVAPSSAPVIWNADASSVGRALAAALNAADQRRPTSSSSGTVN